MPRVFTERFLSGVLTLAVAAMAVVILYRAFAPNSGSGDPTPIPLPTYEPDWPTLITSGRRMGDSSSPVTIVEFGDLQCPACRSYQRILQKIRADFEGKVSLVFVHSPLPYHKYAISAARATECAHREGRIEQFIDRAYLKQDSLGRKPWGELASESGVENLERYSRCVSDTTRVPIVDAGIAASEAFNIQGTPTVIVNGWRYTDPPNEKLLRLLVQTLLDGKVPTAVSGGGAMQRTTPILPSVTHTGGVQSLVHGASAFDLAPRLELEREPLGVAGGQGASPPFDLSRLGVVTLLQDNRLAVAANAKSLLIFSPGGKEERVLGRPGEGPGEFRQISGIARIVDGTFLVVDRLNARLSRISPDRGVLSEARILEMPSSYIQTIGAFRDGRMLVYAPGMLSSGEVGATSRPPAPVQLLTGGQATQTLFNLPDLETVMVHSSIAGDSRWNPTWVRFGAAPQAVLWDTTIVTGAPVGYLLELRGPGGKLSGTIKVTAPRRVVTNRMREVVIERQLSDLTKGPEAPLDVKESSRLIREAPFADSLPAFEKLYVSPGIVLWAVDFMAPTDSTWNATAFRRDGAILGRLSGSINAKPVAFGDDRVVVQTQDADGFTTLEIHRLKPSLARKVP